MSPLFRATVPRSNHRRYIIAGTSSPAHHRAGQIKSRRCPSPAMRRRCFPTSRRDRILRGTSPAGCVYAAMAQRREQGCARSRSGVESLRSRPALRFFRGRPRTRVSPCAADQILTRQRSVGSTHAASRLRRRAQHHRSPARRELTPDAARAAMSCRAQRQRVPRQRWSRPGVAVRSPQ